MDSPACSLLGSARQMLVVPACAALLLGGLANVTLRAQTDPLLGEPISVPLTVNTFEEHSPNGNLMYSASGGTQALPEKPADQIKSEPKLQNPTYYRLRLGGREFLAILDIGKDAEKADLYIDFDGRGLFGAIKGTEGIDRYKDRNPAIPYAGFRFGPITLPKTEAAVAGPVEMMVSCSVSRKEPNMRPYLRVTPQKFVAGKLRMGSAEYAVAFVDGTYAGRFQPFKPDPSVPQPTMVQVHRNGASMMALDLNRNGLLDWRGEISPLVDLVRIDGKYYHVSVAADGSEAKFQETRPELGVFDTRCPGVEMFVVSDKCAALLTANADGKWELPLGKYSTGSFVLSRTEGDTKWALDGAQPSPAMRAFEIKTGTPTVIELGPPLALNYSVDQNGGAPGGPVSIALNVTGKNGETYSAGASKNQQQEPEPRFTIQNETGENLTEGKFEYG